MAGLLAEHEQLLAVVDQRPVLKQLAVFSYSLCCRLGHDGEAACEMALSMTRPDIANYPCVATETASRAIVQLRAMGIPDGYGKQVRIVDPHGLRSLPWWGGS